MGGGGGGNQAGIPEMRYTVSVEKHGPSFQAETLVLEAKKRVSLTEDAYRV